MYNLETNQWTEVASLPDGLNGHKMELLGGKPTIIGGFHSKTKDQNGILYQYEVENDRWQPHQTRMRIPRSSHAAFQVPRELFHC